MTDTVPLANAVELQLSANALKVLRARYLKKDERGHVAETPAGMFRRVAHHDSRLVA